jgi:DNA-binding NtrC family response regulator
MIHMTAARSLSLPSNGVLIATPSSAVRDQVMQKLGSRGPVHATSGGADALAQLESGRWQMLFLDRHLPDLDADELAGIIERRFPATRVVLVDSDQADAVPAAPAFGPSATEETGERTPVPLKKPLASAETPLPGMIGDTLAMRNVYRMARLVAPRETTVLITGPTGSGKDLVARAIHRLSRRAEGAFVVLNCAAIPETLVESELFGYARGAFTGAAQTYAGRILSAQGGTLFLDEIGEMPLAAQSKLLRFLEHKEVQRLGSAETAKADVRILAATNRNLARAVQGGSFREDLYFRLSAFPIRLSSLKDRGADVLRLASHFLLHLGEYGGGIDLDRAAGEKLQAHDWPGNVREMQQVLERAAILSGGAVIRPEHVLFNTEE